MRRRGNHQVESLSPCMSSDVSTLNCEVPGRLSDVQSTTVQLMQPSSVSDDSQNLALTVLNSDDRGIITFEYPSTGNVRRFLSVNDAAREMLQGFRWNFSYDFWRSVDHVGDTGESMILTGVIFRGLHLKMRRVKVGEKTIVVIHAERSQERNIEADFAFQFGGVQKFSDVEKDLFSRVVAGIRTLLISLTTQDSEGCIRFLAVNENIARAHKLSSPREIRGKSVYQLGCSPSDVEAISELYYSNYNFQTGKSNFTALLNGCTTYQEHRTMCPGVVLSVIMVEPRDAKSAQENKSVDEHRVVSKVWKKKQWDVFVESLLQHVKENQKLASISLHKLPNAFLNDERSVYCYVYRGRCIPSGMKDGLKWTSSRNIISGGRLQRRYFYTVLDDGRKMKRRVMWMSDAPELYVVEHRHLSHCGPIVSNQLVGMDWEVLIDAVSERADARMLQSFAELGEEYFDSAAGQSQRSESDDVSNYVNGVLDHAQMVVDNFDWAKMF
ncbi:hypothetical protein PROFUN_04496 [Planoprotostelium fungivorum]|uniref:Uncharacterized protein n=1 Tax=Planoprotostelium fungivorum TaxID=1890364 RepID=A0A2P6NBD9_9EUKA|nr:hypothetical protein PROFUN_04496 [Planoprotostelium fungivorum]